MDSNQILCFELYFDGMIGSISIDQI